MNDKSRSINQPFQSTCSLYTSTHPPTHPSKKENLHLRDREARAEAAFNASSSSCCFPSSSSSVPPPRRGSSRPPIRPQPSLSDSSGSGNSEGGGGGGGGGGEGESPTTEASNPFHVAALVGGTMASRRKASMAKISTMSFPDFWDVSSCHPSSSLPPAHHIKPAVLLATNLLSSTHPPTHSPNRTALLHGESARVATKRRALSPSSPFSSLLLHPPTAPTHPPTHPLTAQLYCKESARVATNNFYAGTLALLLSVATLTFDQLAYNYKSFVCAWLFAGICFLCASVALYFHTQHANTWNPSIPELGQQMGSYLTRQLSGSGASDSSQHGNGRGSSSLPRSFSIPRSRRSTASGGGGRRGGRIRLGRSSSVSSSTATAMRIETLEREVERQLSARPVDENDAEPDLEEIEEIEEEEEEEDYEVDLESGRRR